MTDIIKGASGMKPHCTCLVLCLARDSNRVLEILTPKLVACRLD